MKLNLVDAVEVKTATWGSKYCVFLCADDAQGARIGVEVTGFQPRVLIEASYDTACEIVERVASAKTWSSDHCVGAPQYDWRSVHARHLCGFDSAHSRVAEIRTDSPKFHALVYSACQEQNIKIYRELSVEKQYLQSIGLDFGGWFVVSELRNNENRKRLQRNYQSIRAVPHLEEVAPQPVVLYYDIEANNKCTHEFPNAALGDEVECIGLETNTGDRWMLSRFPIFRTMRKPFDSTIVRVFKSELQLLLEFARIIRDELQPTYICAHNGYGFDIIFIFQAAFRLGLRRYEQLLCPFPFVKGFATYRERTRRTNQLGARDVGEMYVPGLVHLDTLLYSLSTFKLSNYSLNGVASFLKIDMQKDDMTPDELFRAFDCNPKQASLRATACSLQQIGRLLITALGRDTVRLIGEFCGADTRQLWQHAQLGRLAEYCMVDVALLAKMAKRMKLVASIINFGRVTSTSPQEYANIGEQAKSMSLIAHHSMLHNIIVDKDRLPTPEPYPGATVLSATPGLYTVPVICCDFMSLYPSIIQAWNLSYDTILCRGEKLLTPRDVHLRKDQCHEFKISGNRTVYFVKSEVRHGVLPKIVKDLLQRRKAAKALMKTATNETDAMLADCLQKALKVTANALYGFTGVVEHALLSNTYIAQIITLMGRYLISETSKLAESQFPVTVVYGDTDSVFLLPSDPSCSIQKAWKLGEEIAERCTNIFPDPVILEMEKICYPFAQEAKKRYISMVYESPNDEGHFDAKGVDVARRDNALWHREFYAEAMHQICPLPPFTRETIIENVIKVIAKNLSDIEQDKVPLHKYVITKTIKNEKDYAAGQRGEEVNLPQMQAANRFREQISKGFPAEPPRASDRVPYVICAGESKETHRRAEHIEWVRHKNIPPCRLYYLKLLSASLQRFTDATIQDARIADMFDIAIERVDKSMKQINARLSGNMALTSFFSTTRTTTTAIPYTPQQSQQKQQRRPQPKKQKKNQSLELFFAAK